MRPMPCVVDGQSEILEVPALDEVFLTAQFLREECGVEEFDPSIDFFLNKTYAACNPCNQQWVEYRGGYEAGIFHALGGKERALVPFRHVLWHLQQQRYGESGLLSVGGTGTTRFFVSGSKSPHIVRLRWCGPSEGWRLFRQSLDYDETAPLLDIARFIVLR